MLLVMWWTKTSFTFEKFLTIISQTDFVLNLSLCAATDLKTCITKNHSFISIISSNPGVGYGSVIYLWKYFFELLLMDTLVTCFFCWTLYEKHLTKLDIVRAHVDPWWQAAKTRTNRPFIENSDYNWKQNLCLNQT